MISCLEETLKVLKTTKRGNFDAWATLVAEIEETSPDDFQKLTLVYDAFLLEFPLCYGYWRNYAYQMVRLCTIDKAVEVYERAVTAATYSLDLWSDYCTFAMQLYEDTNDVRRLFERGLSFIGKDYRRHILLDKYIEFEYCQKQWSKLAHIYIKALEFPSTKLHRYYESFRKLIALWEEEIKGESCDWLQLGVDLTCELLKSGAWTNSTISKIVGDLVDHPVDLLDPRTLKTYQTVGEVLYDKSYQIDKNIISFENAIRRPYFHAKPLNDCQLENWHRYLDFVEAQGDFDWTVKLYERCLIPCASYREFWIRYAEHMEAKGGREIANLAIERASRTFLKGDCTFYLYSARYKERIGDKLGARAAFLAYKSDSSVDFIGNIDREANMEKRMGNIEEAYSIYEREILLAEETHSPEVLSLLYSRYARFTYSATGCIDAAKEVFLKGLQKLPYNQFLLKFVDLYGTVHEVDKAWKRHRELFPHFGRPVSMDVITEKSILTKEKSPIFPSDKNEDQKSKPVDGNYMNGEPDSNAHPKKKSSSEVLELPTDLAKSTHERSENNGISDMKSEYRKVAIPVKETITLSSQNIQSASFENLSICSSDSITRKYEASNLAANCPQLVFSNSQSVRSDTHIEVSNFTISDQLDRHLEVSTETDHVREHDQVCTTAASGPTRISEAMEKKIEEGALLEGELPFSNRIRHATSVGADKSQKSYGKQTSAERESCKIARCEKAAVLSRPRYSPKISSEGQAQQEHIPQQAWQVQTQHSIQDNIQHMLANFQTCHNGTANPLHNLVQQCYPSAYPSQVISQMVPQSQGQADQLPFLNFAGYGYSLSDQSSPNMWYYYQQMYYMQLQQQNLQLQLQLANNHGKQIHHNAIVLQPHDQEHNDQQRKQQELHQQTSGSTLQIHQHNQQQQLQQQLFQQDSHQLQHPDMAQCQIKNQFNTVYPQYQQLSESQQHLQYHYLQQLLQQQQLFMQQQQQLIRQQQPEHKPIDHQLHQKTLQDQKQLLQQLEQKQFPPTPEHIQAVNNYCLQEQSSEYCQHLGQKNRQQAAAFEVPESVIQEQSESTIQPS